MSMKQIALSLALLFAFSFCNAQTGLQFSQVRLIEVPMPSGVGVTGTVGTVPAGKVWKLENVQTANYNVYLYYTVLNGGTTQYFMPSPSDNHAMNTSAVWYPAGTSIAVKRSVGYTSADNLVFSILEFTVVP